MAAAANAAAIKEMDRKLKRSDEELDLVNKRLHEAQGKLLSKCIVNTAGHLCSGLYDEYVMFGDCSCRRRGWEPQSGVEKAEAEAAEKNAAAEKAVAELEKPKTADEKGGSSGRSAGGAQGCHHEM